MKSRRILILDTGKEWGGGTNSLLELIKRIDKKKYRFTALFYNNYRMGNSGSDIKKELEGLGVEFVVLPRAGRRACIKGIKEAGRALLFFSGGLKRRYVFYLDYLERILPQSKRIASVLSGGYDLLYMNNQPSSNLEGILAAGALGLPCIQHSRVDVRLAAFEAEAVNNWVSKVICVSRGVMDGLTGSGVRPEKCAVIYNGIDRGLRPELGAQVVRARHGIEKDAFVIGTVGSLIKRKRVEVLLKAFSMLKGRDAFWCLAVGSGPEEEALKKEARRLGIEKRVIFTGFSTDALSYINSMDVFALPSEKEGLPRVILEAMLMAKPVAAFDVTGTGELVIDNKTGFILKGESAQDMTTAFEKLQKDRLMAASFGTAGRERVLKEFGIDKYVSGVSAAFEEVLA